MGYFVYWACIFCGGVLWAVVCGFLSRRCVIRFGFLSCVSFFVWSFVNFLFFGWFGEFLECKSFALMVEGRILAAVWFYLLCGFFWYCLSFIVGCLWLWLCVFEVFF